MLNTIIVVPEGMEYTVERFGRYRKTLKPGLTFLPPFIDRVGYRVSMREQKLTVRFEDMVAKDGVFISSSADIYMQVQDSHKMAYESRYLNDAIGSWCERQLKASLKTMSSADALSDVEAIEVTVLEKMKLQENHWGVDINTIDVRKIRLV